MRFALVAVVGCTSEAGRPPPPGLVVDDFSLSLDPDIATMVHATWTDSGFDEAWVEYRFEGDAWQVAPSIETGHAVLLGLPADTEVEARAVVARDDASATSDSATATTGALPEDLLLPAVEAWDESLAWEAPYAMVSVATGNFTFLGPYQVEIFDRSGRVVWYKEVAGLMNTLYPSVSRDGTHIWFDAGDIFGVGRDDPYVTRQTLDGRWSVVLDVPDLGQAIAEGPDDAFFFEYRANREHGLRRLASDGTTSDVWDCAAYFGDLGVQSEYCDMNACNWDETRDTVLASQFYTSTVFEVDVGSGEPVRQFGQMKSGRPWSFDPTDSVFDYQHYPHWTEDGTILVTTHVDGERGVQVAAEYEPDDATETLTRGWSYTSSDLWATQLGEAVRLPNGNTVVGYGQDGAVREVTPEGAVAWQVSWEEDNRGYRVIGHLTLLEDLYALNRGP